MAEPNDIGRLCSFYLHATVLIHPLAIPVQYVHESVSSLNPIHHTIPTPAFAPHCPVGPIGLAACIQVDASTPNFLAQEHLTLGEGFLKSPFVVKDGYLEVLQIWIRLRMTFSYRVFSLHTVAFIL